MMALGVDSSASDPMHLTWISDRVQVIPVSYLFSESVNKFFVMLINCLPNVSHKLNHVHSSQMLFVKPSGAPEC